MSLGVWISWKPSDSSVLLNSCGHVRAQKEGDQGAHEQLRCKCTPLSFLLCPTFYEWQCRTQVCPKASSVHISPIARCRCLCPAPRARCCAPRLHARRRRLHSIRCLRPVSSQAVPPSRALLPPGRPPPLTWHTALCTLKMAWLAGVRRSRKRLSSRRSWPTVGITSPRSAAALTSSCRRRGCG